ncbi:hypothetical protein PN462_13290 [Spirulina sp. CS-785/01]|uniref:hypothetical protein n=1 Tax=Spirulina sp. CS-785/01 TaxID=3021716 RepID=UPI00232AC5FF|nr:hypothetical protein [Spirulina sp. CS-785/01]MDB9314079.1 hypothetical protein [Spirulina sp. CS-785/01]
MNQKKQGLKGTETQAKVRLLLFLWEMGGLTEAVKRSELHKKLVRTRETAKDYEGIFQQLEENGAIALTTQNRSRRVQLTQDGLKTLTDGLKNPQFNFAGKQVGTKAPNALLKWIRAMEGASLSTQPTASTIPPINSYETFEKLALDVYDKLNQNYNFRDLVPIYRIRREIGDKVPRAQFNEWLVDMQANDLIQLMAGEMPDMTPDKREDSLTLPGGAFRYYVQRLNA